MSDPVKPLLTPGEIVLNKYKVIQMLGFGQFGQVFKVWNHNLQQFSALKVVIVRDPSQHRALIEAQAMSLCGHDHVVKIHTADEFNGAVLIEMEFIEGGSLGDRLLREFVPVADSIVYVKQILFALEYAHGRGFVHRDVKPGNIMLAPRNAKLSDFGTAIHAESGLGATALEFFYRPHASPEAANNQEFSPLSDVYAAGMTLQRAANNTPAWGHVRKDEASFRQDILNGKLPQRLGHADWVPRALKTILNRACSGDQAKRYKSAADFRQALERLSILRPWARLSPDEWRCEYDGRVELVRYVPGKKPSIEHLVGSRRKRVNCGSFATEREARRQMERLVAQLTYQ
ncbi:serine/threonine-protein kinase [Bradyrhizobium iriomotense]|uniref:Protein kinase domain-containing protein n=1 Tax=Bradyrhizobium iriomotense TaxID=441950 RepID=A0ABQ6B4X1_9BRAD|nr:serine/threonine-protein kinase [Bradyrhizobium iriomotense]GLR89454.1 hypothetical protein GCM10007857_61670 [Bradyrhizobium iriomotense]